MIENRWNIPLKQARIEGKFAYEAQLELRHDGDAKLKIKSDLQGLGIKLPAPFNKPAQLVLQQNVLPIWHDMMGFVMVIAVKPRRI